MLTDTALLSARIDKNTERSVSKIDNELKKLLDDTKRAYADMYDKKITSKAGVERILNNARQAERLRNPAGVAVESTLLLKKEIFKYAKKAKNIK